MTKEIAVSVKNELGKKLDNKGQRKVIKLMERNTFYTLREYLIDVDGVTVSSKGRIVLEQLGFDTMITTVSQLTYVLRLWADDDEYKPSSKETKVGIRFSLYFLKRALKKWTRKSIDLGKAINIHNMYDNNDPQQENEQ